MRRRGRGRGRGGGGAGPTRGGRPRQGLVRHTVSGSAPANGCARRPYTSADTERPRPWPDPRAGQRPRSRRRGQRALVLLAQLPQRPGRLVAPPYGAQDTDLQGAVGGPGALWLSIERRAVSNSCSGGVDLPVVPQASCATTSANSAAWSRNSGTAAPGWPPRGRRCRGPSPVRSPAPRTGRGRLPAAVRGCPPRPAASLGPVPAQEGAFVSHGGSSSDGPSG